MHSRRWWSEVRALAGDEVGQRDGDRLRLVGEVVVGPALDDNKFFVLRGGPAVELMPVAVAPNALGLSPTTMHSRWVSSTSTWLNASRPTAVVWPLCITGS